MRAATQRDRGSAERPVDPGRFLTREADPEEPAAGRGAVDFPVAVVLPAGGSGERTGLSTPKQFCTFLTRPLISYTIQAFERVPWIERIVVVVAKESHSLMTDIVEKFNHAKVKIVHGGSTRHRSIFCGLQAFAETDESLLHKPKVVIIHDAVRPFVEEDFLHKITMAAKEQGASGAMRPLVSTVIATTSEGYLDHSLERAKYRASEMPQGFLYDIIYQAYQRCSESDFEFGTECLHLALHYCGTNAKLIEGPPTLWKVTYKRDLAAAEAVVKETLSQTACVMTEECAESLDLSHKLLKKLSAEDMLVDVIPNPKGVKGVSLTSNRNFIHISVNSSKLAQIAEMVMVLEETNHALLYPVVIVWVLLTVSEQSALSQRCEAASAIVDLARASEQKNILLYGVQINHSKVPEQWERSVTKLSQLAAALIRDRNPILTGQILQA